MATNVYKNSGVSLTSTNEFIVYTVPAFTTAIIRSIFCTNISVISDADASIYWTDSSNNNNKLFLINQVLVAKKTALDPVTTSFVLEAGDTLSCSSTSANFIHVTVSILETS